MVVFGYGEMGASHTPRRWVVFTKRLFNSDNSVSAALEEVCALVSAILISHFLRVSTNFILIRLFL